MRGTFVIGVPEAEAVRLYRIVLDRDADEALAFLEEHAKKHVHDYFEGG